MSSYELDEENIDKDKLINLVRARPVLWDPSDGNHKKSNLRMNAWIEVAHKELKLNVEPEKAVETAQKIWKNLRDRYKKLKKRKPTGSAGPKGSEWPFFKSLTFLDKTLKDLKHRTSNLHDSDYEKDDSEEEDNERDVENVQMDGDSENGGHGDDMHDGNIQIKMQDRDFFTIGCGPIFKKFEASAKKSTAETSAKKSKKRKSVSDVDDVLLKQLTEPDDEDELWARVVVINLKKIKNEELKFRTKRNMMRILEETVYPGDDVNLN